MLCMMMMIMITLVSVDSVTTADKVDKYSALIMLFGGIIKIVLTADFLDAGFQFRYMIRGVVASTYDAVFV